MSYRLDALITRAERMVKILAPAGEGGELEDKNIDEFTRLKRQAAKQVADIRSMISERDALLESEAGRSKEAVSLSAKVRSELRSLKEVNQQMKEMHQKSLEKKRGKKVLPAGELDQRAEVIDLLQQHILECEQLEKKRFANGAAARAELSAGVGISSRNVKRTAEVTELRDLNDPEIESGLQMLAKKDAELDAQLDELSKGVGRMKEIALAMKTEIVVQNQIITEITTEVDKVSDHLHVLNAKIKDALEQVGGLQRVLVYAILFVILLAVAIYLYTVINKGKSDSSGDGSGDGGANNSTRSFFDLF